MNTEELRETLTRAIQLINRAYGSNQANAIDALHTALAVPDKLATLEAENAALRRRWCLDVCPSAYMDDGEAQDSTEHPSIDYLRDSLETIYEKRRKRFFARSKT